MRPRIGPQSLRNVNKDGVVEFWSRRKVLRDRDPVSHHLRCSTGQDGIGIQPHLICQKHYTDEHSQVGKQCRPLIQPFVYSNRVMEGVRALSGNPLTLASIMAANAGIG